MKTLNVMLSNLGGRVVPIGYEGENLYTRIRINCIEVFADYPDATVSMVVNSPVGQMYPAVIEKSGVMVIWDITDAVLSSNGSGECQLTFTDGDVVRKSVVFGISINRSLIASGDPPEPVQEWIDKAEQTAQEIAENAANLAKEDIVESYGSIAPAIIETASGAIASFSDGADGMLVKKMTVEIDPVQDLHGYDNPWPAGGGKNKYDFGKETQTINGITFTRNLDGSYKATGTATAIVVFKGQDVTLPAGAYMCSAITTGTTNLNASVYVNNTWALSITTTPKALTLSEESSVRFNFYVANGETANITFYPQIEVGSTATDYAPFENVCPISGWTGANVSRTGKNLFSYDNLYGGYWMTNGFTGSGEPISYSPGFGWCFVRIPVEAGDTITISGCQQLGGTKSAFYHDTPNNVISDFLNTSQNGTKIVPEGANYLGLCILRNSEYDPKTEYPNAQVEIASSASTFEPYNASEIEYEFPEAAKPVYGGTLTIHQDGSGELVVDIVKHSVPTGFALLDTINGVCRFSRTRNNVWDEIPKGYSAGGVVISNALTPVASIGLVNPQPYTISVYESANDLIRIALPSTVADTAEKANQWITDNGIEVAYEVATPVTYQLTNQQVVSLLKGVNNVWADTGDVALEYPADTKLYIDARVAELQALILENISNS